MGVAFQMNTQVSIRICKKRLGLLWLSSSLVIFLILVGQSIFGKFGDHVEKAWAWFLPTVMPTLMLIVSVWAHDALQEKGGTHKVDRSMYVVSVVLSLLYLFTVAATFLVQPFTDMSLLVLMQLSNLWLGPLQSLVAGALGVFFVKT